MHKRRWALLALGSFFLLIVLLAAIFWPWVRLWLPHPALVTAWYRYLVIDLNIGRWGPAAVLLLVAIIELVWALNLGRRSSAFERQWTRLERMHNRELEVLEQQVDQLEDERAALLGELELLDDLIAEEKGRLWARFDALQQTAGLPVSTDFSTGILRGHAVVHEAADLPVEVRGEARQIIAQLERIDITSTASGRKVQSELQAEQRVNELLRLGSACHRLGQHERALRHFNKAVELSPANVALLVNRAVVNQELGRPQWALQDLDRALRLDEHAWAYLYRGAVRELLGEPRRALEDYARAIRTYNGAFAEAHHRRGLLYAGMGEHDKAYQDQNRVLELQPRHAAALTARGLARAALGDWQWALNDLDQGCVLAPLSYSAFYHRGQVRARLQMHEEALADLERVIALEPSFAPAFTARGDVYMRIGEYFLAIPEYERAIELQPKNPASHYARGEARAATREYRQAIEDYDRTLRLDPGHTLALASRGLAREKLGEYAQAIVDLDRAIALDPNLAIAYYTRGLAYGSLGEYDRASRDLDKAVELDPSLRNQIQASPGLLSG
jgi:tetratricopeptide (TPR) repeat protein